MNSFPHGLANAAILKAVEKQENIYDSVGNQQEFHGFVKPANH